MTEFKPGDRVVIVGRAPLSALKVGTTATVLDDSKWSYRVLIRLDDGRRYSIDCLRLEHLDAATWLGELTK